MTFFFKFVTSVRGGHCSFLTRGPKTLLQQCGVSVGLLHNGSACFPLRIRSIESPLSNGCLPQDPTPLKGSLDCLHWRIRALIFWCYSRYLTHVLQREGRKMCFILTHMSGNTCWHSFICGSGPPSSGSHFRLLRFIPEVLYVGMLPMWSDDLVDLSSDTCALLNLATCHKRTSQETHGLVVRHPHLGHC